jgi:hypothetical protein
MRTSTIFLTLLVLAAPYGAIDAMTSPLICAGGTPLGWIEMKVTRTPDGAPLDIQKVNSLVEGDTISYRPVKIQSIEPKKVRIEVLLAPADGSKILVSDPRPADKPTSWKVPFRAQLVSVVWGPQGLDKAKVANLVTKNTDLIAQLADYAEKTEDTQALIQAIAQQQTLEKSQDLDAAVASFAKQFPSTKVDRTQPAQAQLGTMLSGVNSSLATYDPLAQNPQERATQSAGLIASVAGMFLGGPEGIAASGGATALVSLHGVLFPRTEFLSALATNTGGDASENIGLCGSKAPAAVRTEFAWLWAIRIPNAVAPQLALPTTEHLPIGIRSAIPVSVKGADWKLMTRVHGWKLVSADNMRSLTVPVSANVTTKTLDLDLTGNKVKAGIWKLTADWDWAPITVSGSLVLHDFPKLESVHLAKRSQDRLIAGAGTLDLDLTGDDFEFVKKIEFKKPDDLFGTAQTVPFRVMKAISDGPQSSVKIRLDAKDLNTGNYIFLIAQTDDKLHEVPFKVLPKPPSIAGTPIVVNMGDAAQTVVLHGAGLDRIETLSADGARITLADPDGADTRSATVTLEPEVKAGALLAARIKAQGFEEEISVPDAFLVAGRKPQITTVHESRHDGGPGISLNRGEMSLDSLVSFEIGVSHAPAISALNLGCKDSESQGVKITMGDAKPDAKLTQESAGTVFLVFAPRNVGAPGCRLMATLVTIASGQSEARELGTIVLLPKIDSFQLSDERADGFSYYATLEGDDLENIAKVGWDADTGLPVEEIPAPESGNKERLQVAIPWPAPSPHAPLYVWLRGENQGRLTSSRY